MAGLLVMFILYKKEAQIVRKQLTYMFTYGYKDCFYVYVLDYIEAVQFLFLLIKMLFATWHANLFCARYFSLHNTQCHAAQNFSWNLVFLFLAKAKLETGSMVQFGNPIQYGVIKRIVTAVDSSVILAEVETVSYMATG